MCGANPHPHNSAIVAVAEVSFSEGSGVDFNGEKRSSVLDTGPEMAGSIPARRKLSVIGFGTMILAYAGSAFLMWN